MFPWDRESWGPGPLRLFRSGAGAGDQWGLQPARVACGDPRIQSVDPRRRHRGLSHHTVTNLASVALAPAVVPLPQPLPAEILGEIGTLQERCRVRHHWLDVPVTVGEVENRLPGLSGEGPQYGARGREDPLFYRTVSAAAAAAFQLWKLIGAGWTAADATAHLMSTGVRTIPATKPAPATLSRRS